MKTLLIISLSLIITLQVQAVEQEKEPKNFRGLEWGVNLSKNKNLYTYIKMEGVHFFKNRQDKMSIGDAVISNLFYGSYKDRLYSVTILAEGSLEFEKLKTTFEKTYGSYYQKNPYIKTYYWFFEKVTISFEYNQFSKETTINYFYDPIREEKNKDNEDKAAAGKKDL